MGKNTVVYTETRYIFSVDPDTLEPKGTSMYDPYLFIDPEPNTTYIPIDEWERIRRNKGDTYETKKTKASYTTG